MVLYNQRPDEHPWDVLPPFFEDMVNAISTPPALLDDFSQPAHFQEFPCGTWDTPAQGPALNPYKITIPAASPPTRKCWIDYNNANGADITTELTYTSGGPITTMDRRIDFACGSYGSGCSCTFEYLNAGGDIAFSNLVGAHTPGVAPDLSKIKAIVVMIQDRNGNAHFIMDGVEFYQYYKVRHFSSGQILEIIKISRILSSGTTVNHLINIHTCLCKPDSLFPVHLVSTIKITLTFSV